MIYRGFRIGATVADWHRYDLNQDGTLGEFMGNGGIDADSAEYDVYSHPNSDEEELIDGGYETIDQAKKAIDNLKDQAQAVAV